MKKFDFGANLRKIRKEKGISQEAIANYLGISQKTYSRMEYNETKCTSEQISKIAYFYKVDPAELQPQENVAQILEQSSKEKKFLGLSLRHFITATIYLVLVPSAWECTRAFCVEFKASENTIAAAPRIAAVVMAIFIWYAFKRFNADKTNPV